MPFDQRAFRDALGCFTTGVTILTARTGDGKIAGITANSFTSISLDPPLVLFSVGRSSRSLQAFLDADRFAVNILSAGQAELSNRFAKSGDQKWEGVAFDEGTGGCPVLEDSMAILECVPHQTIEGGDHVIFLVEVTGMRMRPEGEPLVYFQGGYQKIAGAS